MSRTRENPMVGRRMMLALLGGVTIAALGSCGSTATLVDLWKDPQYASTSMTKMLVVAMRNDAGIRRIWEDGLAGELGKHGVIADPSYRLFPNSVPTIEQVEDIARARGYDGVLLSHRLAPETVKRYVPGYVRDVPVTRYNPWTDRYRTYFRRIHEPGYVETDRLVRTQTEVWSTEGGWRMVWTATGRSLNPSSAQEAIREIGKKIVPELAKQRIIPPKASSVATRAS